MDTSSAEELAGSGQPVRIVIKIGTSSLINEKTNSPSLTNLARICECVRRLRDLGHSVCLVTSGAVGMGCQAMRLEKRPEELEKKQALAAVGQGVLMRHYSEMFSALSLTCAQVLLTAESLSSEFQYALAKRTLLELFNMGVVPIVNENDTVNVREIRFGDNDTLSAQVAAMVAADWLVLLTDVDCLYTANPSTNPNAQPIHEVRDVATLQVDTSTSGTQWGTGGMATKLTAARIACAAGCSMLICNSTKPESMEAILRGEQRGTIFYPVSSKMGDRKRFILSVPCKGKLNVDDGCARALLDKKNLYAAGIKSVDGEFGVMDAVRILRNGVEIARGLVNYTSMELDRMKGLASHVFPDDLRYSGPAQVIFREDIALLTTASDGS